MVRVTWAAAARGNGHSLSHFLSAIYDFIHTANVSLDIRVDSA